jgi:hypothetical protein
MMVLNLELAAAAPVNGGLGDAPPAGDAADATPTDPAWAGTGAGTDIFMGFTSDACRLRKESSRSPSAEAVAV